MVLSKSSLSKFGITEKDIDDNSNQWYDLLDYKRNEFFRIEYARFSQKVIICRQKHNKSLELIQNLKKKDTDKIKEYLLSIN